MRVGTLILHGMIREARSLKEKRRVLNRVKDRLGQEFNISIAEVDYQNSPQRCALGVATVANDARFINSVLSNIVNHMRLFRGFELLDHEMEIY